MEVCSRKGEIALEARGCAGGEVSERFVGKVFHADLVAWGERVVATDYRHQPIGTEMTECHTARLSAFREAEKRDVHLTLTDRLLEFVASGDAQREMNVRVSSTQELDRLRYVDGGDRWYHPHPQLSAGTAGGRGCINGGAVSRLQSRTCVREERASCSRQFHTPARPVEENDAELILEALDLVAEARLGDKTTRSGAGEARLLGDGHYVAKLLKIHLLIVFPDGCQHDYVLDGLVAAAED